MPERFAKIHRFGGDRKRPSVCYSDPAEDRRRKVENLSKMLALRVLRANRGWEDY